MGSGRDGAGEARGRVVRLSWVAAGVCLGVLLVTGAYLMGRAHGRAEMAARGSSAPPGRVEAGGRAGASEGRGGARPAALAGTAGGTELWDRLEEWATAMASTDAEAQASFYAAHMDRYFLRTGVSNAVVARDKRDFLRSGRRVRSFELQDVEVEEQTESEARVRLVKHYVEQAMPGGVAKERFVRSELNLRKVDGRWMITGERDFR